MPEAAQPLPLTSRVPTPTDEEVVERIVAGEPALFELLMRRHNQRVYRAIRSVLRDEADVEDTMQQAYLNAFARLGTFKGSSRFSTWLVRVAINEALMLLRKRRPLEPLEDLSSEDAMASPLPSPEAHTGARELTRAVEACIDALPALYRSTFVLREVEGLSTAETAEVLGVSEDVVKTRLLRARRQMHQALEEMLGKEARSAFSFEAPRCDRVVAAVLDRLLDP